jgi:hypothetical protein
MDTSMKPTPSLRNVSIASTLSLVAACGIAFAVASGQSQSIAAPPPPNERTDESAAVGKSKIDNDQYLVEMKSAGSYKANSEGTVEIAITPKGDYHINDKYPVKFKAAEPADGSIKYPKPLLKREDGTFSEKQGAFKVPFVATRAGKAKVSGTLSVSVCSERNCIMDKLELDLDVDVQ